MKRVLFVAYHVPPRTGIATNRTRQLVRWLPEFGWAVTIVTPRFSAVSMDDPAIVQTGVFDLRSAIKRAMGEPSYATGEGGLEGARTVAKPWRRALNRMGSAITSYPDREIGWLPYGVAAARSLLQSGRYDVVLSSSLPVTAHFIAARTKGGTPWVADFRDLWSQNHNLVRTRLRAWSDGLLEKLTISGASALTTTSEPLAQRLHDHFPAKRVLSIPNSYDEEEWAAVPFGSEDRCTLLYAGQFAEGRRDPGMLFEAISALRRGGRLQAGDLAVDLYCPHYDWLQPMVARFGLDDIVRMRGQTDRAQVLAAERRADALLVALWDDPNEVGMYTGKLFEYIGARRPILAFGGPRQSVVEETLSGSGLGWRCLDAQALQQRVRELVLAHKRDGSAIMVQVESSQFSSRIMARKFAGLFDEVSQARE